MLASLAYCNTLFFPHSFSSYAKPQNKSTRSMEDANEEVIVPSALWNIPDGHRILTSFTAHTDTNHNEKNNCYQMIIGGNSVTTIGNVVIDSGLLPKAGVPSMLWRVKDFSSGLLVLQLSSSVYCMESCERSKEVVPFHGG